MADLPCSAVHNYVNLTLQCAFAQNNKDCRDGEGIFNYVNFIYCGFENTTLSIALCVVWLIILFVILGTTADDFFCPSLNVIANTLHLSHNVAGVTFLAFGNGAPDIFSAVAGVNQTRPDLVIGALFGAGIFVTSVVAGSIMLVAPFDMTERPFLRDIIFYLFATYWTFYLFYRGRVTFKDSLGFIFLYIAYLCVVLVAHYIYQKWFKPKTLTTLLKTNTPILITVASPTGGIVCQNEDLEDDKMSDYFWRRRSLERRHSVHSGPRSRSSSVVSQVSVNSDDNFGVDSLTVSRSRTPSRVRSPSTVSSNATLAVPNTNELTPLLLAESNGAIVEVPMSEFVRFLRAVSPVDPELWSELQAWQKVLRVLTSPLVIILKFTIPVVDYDKKMSNWCRSLIVLNSIIAPTFVVFAIGYGKYQLGVGFPIWGLTLLIGAVLAVIILCTSRNTQPPIYHKVFSFGGFGSSVVWIYCVANEIVSVLKMVGVVASLSDAILGLTVLAWGNSLPDLIADVSLARQNMPQMGMSGCFGGPLFNLLLGIGIPFTILTLKQDNHSVQVSYEQSTTILTIFLFSSIISSLIVIPLMKFNTKRFYGIYLIILYFVFLIVSVLNEVKSL